MLRAPYKDDSMKILQKPTAIWALVAASAVSIACMATMLPSHKKPLTPAQLAKLKKEATSNIKSLQLGVIMYATDNDDVYPIGPKSKDILNEIYPYIKSRSIYKDLNPNGGQLDFNYNLNGVDSKTIPEPANTPYVFDSKPWPDGTRPVAFTDGHAKFETKKEWIVTSKYLQKWFRKVGPKTPWWLPSLTTYRNLCPIGG